MDAYDPLLLSRRTWIAERDSPPGTNLRGPEWVRPHHGVVRPGFVGHDAVTTRVGDAVALLGTHNVLGGWAALWSSGNTWFDGRTAREDPDDVLIHCLPGSQLRKRRGIRPSEGLVHPEEHVDLGGFRCATLARAAFDEMCRVRSLTEAVVIADMATSTVSHVPHTTADAIERVLASHHKVRGIVRAREAMAFVTPRSASPAESRIRMLVVNDAGIRRLQVNQPIFDLHGNLAGVVDLFEEETGLAIEVDGEHHLTRDQLTQDRNRQSDLDAIGITVARLTTDDQRDRWGTVGRLHRARATARDRQRSWTLEPPGWWSTSRVGQRWG